MPTVLAVAYGTAKSQAVWSALNGGVVNGLITHASLARAVLAIPRRFRAALAAAPVPAGTGRAGACLSLRCREPLLLGGAVANRRPGVSGRQHRPAAGGARTGRPPTRCCGIWPRPASPARRGCWRVDDDHRVAVLDPGPGRAQPAAGLVAERIDTLSASPGWSGASTPADPVLRSGRRRVAGAGAGASIGAALISHNDLHPGNIIFAGGPAVGLIDFDLAGPGRPVWDLATRAAQLGAAGRRCRPAGRLALRRDRDRRDVRTGGPRCCWTPTAGRGRAGWRSSTP